MGTWSARRDDSDHLSMVFLHGLGVTTAGTSPGRSRRPPSARNCYRVHASATLSGGGSHARHRIPHRPPPSRWHQVIGEPTFANDHDAKFSHRPKWPLPVGIGGRSHRNAQSIAVMLAGVRRFTLPDASITLPERHDWTVGNRESPLYPIDTTDFILVAGVGFEPTTFRL